MALIRPGRASRRPGYTKRGFLLAVRKGKIYARAWPRRRGTPKYSYMRDQNLLFKLVALAIKLLSTEDRQGMDSGLQDFLNENRGVRGTAAVRARDWFTQVMFGRAWAINMPDGRRVWPASVVQDCSDVLDHLEPRIGSLLTRTDDSWLCTVQCQQGQVLFLSSGGPDSTCCPPASTPGREQAVGGH
jgi:hypothetical protein